MSLQDFLQQMEAQGECDSEGQFTVSLEKAAWKLAQYRLSHRHDFALHVLICAVLSGAREFSVESTELGIQLHFEGRAFEPDELAWLSRQSESGGTERVKELQIAISGAGAFERVEVSISGGGVSQTLKVKEGSVTVYPVAADSRPGLTFSVKTDEALECVARVNRRGRFAPLDLVLNEVEVNRHLDFGLMRSEVYAFHHVEGMEVLRFRDPEKAPKKPWISRKKSPRSPSLLLCLVDPKQAREEKFYFLSGGVTLEQEERPFRLSLLQGAVTVTHLDKDFGQTALIRKESFDDFQTWLGKEIDHFLRNFCGQAPRLSKRFEQRFCRDLRSHFQGREKPAEVQAYLGRTEDVPRPLTTEILHDIGKDKRLGKDGGLYSRVESILERRLVRNWHEADFSKYSAAHEGLHDLHGVSGSERANDPCSAYLLGLEFDRDWVRQTVLDQGLPSVLRFRALMIYQSELQEYKLFEFLRDLKGLETWVEPLEALSARTFKRQGSEFWPLVRKLLQGTWSATPKLISLIRTHPALSKDYRFWHSTLSRHAQGKMVWADQVRSTMLGWFVPNLGGEEAKSVRRLRTLQLEEATLLFPQLKESDTDRMLHTLVLLALEHASRGQALPRSLLCQALLWRSLCGNKEEVSLQMPLASDPFGVYEPE